MSAHALLLPKREVRRIRQMLGERNWLVKIRDVDPAAEKMYRGAEEEGLATEAATGGCRLIEVTALAERALLSPLTHEDEDIRELRSFVVRLEPLVEAGELQGPLPQFKFADLFCGVGGFACGLGSGGFEGLKGRCLLACDSDVQARDIYLLNHGTPAFGISDDVCSLRRLPKGLDLLTGGFPCQSFSNAAGDPKGFACGRNGLLFFEIPRLLSIFQSPETEAPKTLLLENVGHLLHIDGGKVIQIVVAELERCGYDVTYKLLASDRVAGLAQCRERVYIVGFRKDLTGAMERFSFPEEEFAPAGPAPSGGPCDAPGGSKERAAAVKDILETPAGGAAGALLSSRLTAHQWQKVIASPGWQTSVKTRRRMVDPERGARTLTGNYRRGYECQTEFVEWEGVQEEGECDAWVSPSSGADADRFRRPRFFTPRECARLQGFPETFVIAGHRARSSPNRWYHQAGNAVAPPVVAKVARRILEAAAII